ncbi:MAG: glycosyltransferase family 4 protein [Clostridiales bacterium]|nr:glycosyltransferase family 4 protein [Clostridiales bacterium]
MKVLYVASVVKIHIAVFHIPYLKMLKESRYETHVCAANDYASDEVCSIPYCDRYYDIPFKRNPFNFQNIKAYFQLKKIINSNKYDIIHCHTPIGGVLARLAARKARKTGTKVVYTAHGFHFFEGASLKNWLIYFPVEKLLSKYTDALITLNEEDYKRACDFKTAKVYRVPGVGINTEAFMQYSKDFAEKLRRDLGLSASDMILTYVGELSYRKHQDFLIQVIAKLKTEIPELRLILIGSGNYSEEYMKLSDSLNCRDQIRFLGFRKDVAELLSITDLYVSASRQEGLPVNVMEAMSAGLPVVCFNIRGNKELVENSKGGFLIDIDDIDKFICKIGELVKSKALRLKMGTFNKSKISEYDKNITVNVIKEIYEDIL